MAITYNPGKHTQAGEKVNQMAANVANTVQSGFESVTKTIETEWVGNDAHDFEVALKECLDNVVKTFNDNCKVVLDIFDAMGDNAARMSQITKANVSFTQPSFDISVASFDESAHEKFGLINGPQAAGTIQGEAEGLLNSILQTVQSSTSELQSTDVFEGDEIQPAITKLHSAVEEQISEAFKQLINTDLKQKLEERVNEFKAMESSNAGMANGAVSQ